jgi:hypothetical protein
MKSVQVEKSKTETQRATQVRRAWQPPKLIMEQAEDTAGTKGGGPEVNMSTGIGS